MKNNIDFYQHYAGSDQHPKFKMLRAIYGWAGEGQFWALNNRIAQAENCCLNISKKYNRAAVASDLGFDLETFDEYIKCLLEDCELIRECEKGIITTDIIQENFQRVSIDRHLARERSKKRWEKIDRSSPEKEESSPEKVSKVKESKVKNKYYCKFLLKDNSEYQLTSDQINKFLTAYPDIDFKSEFLKITAWCDNNADKRKTRRGSPRFLNNWFSGAQEKAIANKKPSVQDIVNNQTPIEELIS